MACSITDIEGISVGSVDNLKALTGCTVILTGKSGAVCGVDVRGGGPGTRETDLLAPVNMIDRVHALLLTGGSAYGLDAAGGVMQYLEENGIGHPVGVTVVPIVPAAVLFDLGVGDYRVRPDREMGYQACLAAGSQVREGNAGAGAGATVGKARGYQHCTKSGLGSWSICLEGGLVVGALVVVNALGDVVDPRNGEIIAGVRGDDGGIKFPGTASVWQRQAGKIDLYSGTNTTLAVVACNARLNKGQVTKIAQMAHDGLARVIKPVHTMFDGDTVFALAAGEVRADVNYVGYMVQEALSTAVIRAIEAADSIAGVRSYRE